VMLLLVEELRMVTALGKQASDSSQFILDLKVLKNQNCTLQLGVQQILVLPLKITTQRNMSND
jgi:hypothetical protein